MPDEENLDLIKRTWRVGRKVGRTVYAQVGDKPSDSDRLIGVFDTRELAADAVRTHNASILYRCPECGLHYEDEQIAKQCEAYCKEHNGCSLEITKSSVERSSAAENRAHEDNVTYGLSGKGL